MPQDGLRSAVYRSFITCDDPKGVVECGMVRTCKTSSGKMERDIESRKTKDSFPSLAHKAEKEKMVSKRIAEEVPCSPSSLQLLEVSRGAQKLNQMIDSWSKSLSYEGQSKDIAKDLLKGALDLQDSLVMLGKLQEASRYMAKLKKKQKEKSERGRIDEVQTGRLNSYHIGDQHHQMGSQKPRPSADGSSRDCYEELRKVITESFARQNLLHKSTREDKNGFHQRNLGSAFDIPSTSSSQSSIVHDNNFSSTESSLPSATAPKKAKAPNVIAKLMGLEEFPSKPLWSITHGQSQGQKIPYHQRPVFEIDVPKLRKPSFDVEVEDNEQRTLKEIHGTMQFKGLLKRTSVKKIEKQSRHCNDSYLKQRLIDDFPPIVLIRPLHVPCLESEASKIKVFEEKGPLNRKTMLRKLKVKEDFPFEKREQKERGKNSSKICRKMGAEETPIKKLSQEGAVVQKHFDPKLLEEKDIKTRKGSSKTKASGTINHQPPRMEAIDKKANKALKATFTSKRQIEKDMGKGNSVSRPQGQVKMTPAKAKKPENGSNVARKQMTQQQCSTTSNCRKQIIIHSSSDGNRSLRKKEKPFPGPTATKLTTENLGCEEEEKVIDLSCQSDSCSVSSNTIAADQLHSKEETYSSECLIGEYCNGGEYTPCDNMLMNSENEKDLNSVEEVSNHLSLTGTDNKGFETETSLKALILSSPDFLSLAEELFDFNVNGARVLQRLDISDSIFSSQRLSIDCANELVERRSLPDFQVFDPLLQTQMRNIRTCTSLDQLLEEVCGAVETLRSYSKFAGNNHPTDSFCAILERDIKCKVLVSGIWDLGWRHGFSVDDMEQVVNELEKLILSGLIEEIW